VALPAVPASPAVITRKTKAAAAPDTSRTANAHIAISDAVLDALYTCKTSTELDNEMKASPRDKGTDCMGNSNTTSLKT